MTIGNDAGTAAAIAKMGSTNVSKPVTEACVDEKNHLVTTPAYMYAEAPVHQVYEGIGAMIDGVMSLASATVR